MTTKKEWLKGQKLEREFHNLSFKEGWKHYKDTYTQYFKYLDIKRNLKGKTIWELGPADFPALGYCRNLGNCCVVEPMRGEHLTKICNKKGIFIINCMMEEINTEKLRSEIDEIWMFNVLQHVIAPAVIINKIKYLTDTIRFFEPIDTPIDECHFHTFNLEYYVAQFGEYVKYYPPNPDAVNFHKWQCAYGVWHDYR